MKNKIIKFASAAFVLFTMATFTSCESDSSPVQQAPDENATTVPGISTAKPSTNLFGNGVNLQPSYYNNGNPNFAWALMKSKTKIKTVRIEVEPDKVSQAVGWISNAKSNGFKVIVTYHKSAVLGSDSTSELTAAANWWKTNYAALAASGSITVNLMNEWGSHNITSNAFASAYNNAISIVRQVYSGNIIIDIPGYGQEANTATNAVLGTGGTKINDTKIILSAHIYPGAYNQAENRYMNTSDITKMETANVPCMIGEFGNSGGSGADWSAIVDFAKTKSWTVLGWAWNGDGGSMNMVTPSWATNPTATSFSTSSYFNVVYNKL